MALPFIAGLAVGAGVVYALKNSSSVKDKAKEIFGKSKDFACTKVEQGKEVVADVKDTVEATKECIKEKKEARKLQEKVVEQIEKKDEEECKAE
ncbi:hypothetical protein CPU12_12935 [Malaciobacter molluscorum LMG 25693]|uniref:YtxH domain-containing protein n=1 Tax=Malaciobacter molluscorum LMG 25693 TaxID=870501 RepID=A0A2G1DEN2_9BACT|nr:hypothetical protein [Malaciobacter molluscorum]AXX93086.1 hypothetical protein AMOL_2133 [Malaciobacter molluscorum LMG 25693]PHO16947.1 hypothetical protein CPU12_12935 [Malaciobacter molluscorum LMG 25693]RXJ95556.1 hypothetical protein CRV00_03685 [Malaciobacter molluscorum]